MVRRVADARAGLDGLRQRLAQQSPAVRLGRDRQALDDLVRRASAQLRHSIDLRHARLAGAGAQLAALNPLATLGRGYAVVRRAAGQIVIEPGQVAVGEALVVTVAGGEFDVQKIGEP
jgi:exodeoxyribonuclease VII large subunit